MTGKTALVGGRDAARVQLEALRRIDPVLAVQLELAFWRGARGVERPAEALCGVQPVRRSVFEEEAVVLCRFSR